MIPAKLELCSLCKERAIGFIQFGISDFDIIVIRRCFCAKHEQEIIKKSVRK